MMRLIIFALAFSCLVPPASAATFAWLHLINENFVALGEEIDYHIVVVAGTATADNKDRAFNKMCTCGSS